MVSFIGVLSARVYDMRMALGAETGNGRAANDRCRVGDVLYGPASDARFLVIEAGTAECIPSLDGTPLARGRPQPCSKAAHPLGRCDVRGGERYVDSVSGLSLLCVWPGAGVLRCDGRRLTRLPSRTG